MIRKSFLCLVALAAITACTNKNNKNMTENKAIDSANMDMSAKPGDDFYQYANGGWSKKNPIPEAFSRYGNFEKLDEENKKQLKTIMEEAINNKGAAKGSNQQKIGDFYASGLDSTKIEADGIKPLKPEFDMIAAVKTPADLVNTIAKLHSYGTYPLFYIFSSQDEKNSTSVIAQTYQGGLGLPEKDYYVNNDENSKNIRTAYVAHIANMFKLIGKADADAKKIATSIMAFETRLAKASKSMLELRDPIANYNKINIEKLQKLTPDFDWKLYFTGIGLANPGDINVGQEAFFVEFGKMVKAEKLDVWKDYLTWNLVRGAAPYLSKAFDAENFNFFGKTLTGKTQQQERWKRVLSTTSASLGEIVGQAYVEKYFPPQAKERMIELVNNLKASFAERLKSLKWMSEGTKKKAIEKLEAINVKIGYPDKWRDYSKLDITRDSYVRNIMNSDHQAFVYDLSKIGKPVNRGEWGMTPQTINAYYSPNMNEIVFPAAILQEPFFFLNADDAVNYAAIGTIIAHEMTHGFDDQGRLYDKDGNLTNWWTKEDSAQFVKYTSILVEQFDNFKILDSLHVDGKLTLGENIADLGGITISYNAFKMANKDNKAKIHGFTPQQRFFLSYGQVWRTNIREQMQRMYLKVDVHSPAIARINGIVYNVPEFYEAFGIKEGKRFIAADKRAVIW